MEYNFLGNSGLSVSKISYGSWRTTVGAEGEKNSLACHNFAFESGINLFDTADVYNNGQAEMVVGKFLKEHNREEVVVATKCWGKIHNGPNGNGLSRKHITEACNDSLKRLGVDYIDLYQAHSTSPNIPLYETISTFHLLIQQGKILYWGASNWPAEMIFEAERICKKYRFEKMISLQPKYNILYRHIENDVQPACHSLGVGMILYSPLAQGLLTSKYKNFSVPENSRAQERDAMQEELKQDYNRFALTELHALAEKWGAPLNHIALQWLFAKPAVNSAIIGAKSVDQLKENIETMNTTLPPDFVKDIDQILVIRDAMIKQHDAHQILTETVMKNE